MRLLIHDIEPELYLDSIRSRFPDLEITTHTVYEGLDSVVDRVRPQYVISQVFLAGPPYPRAPLMECETVEWLHILGAGYGHLAPWDPGRITVTNAATVQADTMAQYVLGGVFALNFEFFEFQRDREERRWNTHRVTSAVGQTMVVVGLGPIGRTLAHRARGMGLEVIGVRRRAEAIEGIDRVFAIDDLHEALALADVVAIVLPLNKATRNLIDAEAFAAMRPGTVFVNVARGAVVDEPALIDALRSGHLRGAVLDVFAEEPLPEDSPIWTVDNLIYTPHISSVFGGWERQAVGLFCDNLARRLAGEPMTAVIRPG